MGERGGLYAVQGRKIVRALNQRRGSRVNVGY
jgi:hypothetical protein